MDEGRASREELRRFFAKQMAAASRSSDPRLERIFELVPRELFVPPGPWKLWVGNDYIETPSSDPAYIYQNSLVALKADKGINNGEPFHHAAWIGAVRPGPGEIVTHIGAGTGYYSAILSMLVLPGGRVTAIEIEKDLAASARTNLVPFENATVMAASASELALPPSDVIYVNAGVVAPPLAWLKALRPGGRMIFPWRPATGVGIAVLLTRSSTGFELKPLLPSFFIACVGQFDQGPALGLADAGAAWRSRSIHLTAEKQPDVTATAVYRDVWFSSEQLQE